MEQILEEAATLVHDWNPDFKLFPAVFGLLPPGYAGNYNQEAKQIVLTFDPDPAAVAASWVHESFHANMDTAGKLDRTRHAALETEAYQAETEFEEWYVTKYHKVPEGVAGRGWIAKLALKLKNNGVLSACLVDPMYCAPEINSGGYE